MTDVPKPTAAASKKEVDAEKIPKAAHVEEKSSELPATQWVICLMWKVGPVSPPLRNSKAILLCVSAGWLSWFITSLSGLRSPKVSEPQKEPEAAHPDLSTEKPDPRKPADVQTTLDVCPSSAVSHVSQKD